MPRTAVMLVAATLLAGACAAPGGADHADAPSAGAWSPAPPSAQDRPSSAPPTGTSDSGTQESMVADGQVTADEYERAVRATVDCVRAEGFTVEGPARYPDAPVYHTAPGADPRDYLYWAAADVDDEEEFYAVSDRCTARWSEKVEAAWAAQHEPSEAEVQAWLERAWACLREREVPLSDPPTAQEAELSVQHGCRPWETG